MRPLAIIALLMTLGTSSPAHAQVGYDTPNARVEVLGLNHWTLQQLRDSLKAKRPGLELEDAACMAVLRNDLHFADALVLYSTYQRSTVGKVLHYVVIKLVEPQDAARVHWRTVPHDSTTILRPEYASVVIGATDTAGTLWSGRIIPPLAYYSSDSAQRERLMAGRPLQAQGDAQRLWSFLDARRGETDWRRAVRVLSTDASYADRMVAAMILSNFADRDSSWYALVEALRDPEETVRTAASVVLYSYPRRVIDWTPETQSLRLLLGGTNVRATDQVFELLAYSGTRPALAPALLRDNMQWIAAHLRSAYPSDNAGARAMLTQLNAGRDLGADPAAWVQWAGRL